MSTFAGHAEDCKDILYYYQRIVSHCVAVIQHCGVDCTVEVCLDFVAELRFLPAGGGQRGVCAAVAVLQAVGVFDFAGGDIAAMRYDTSVCADRRHDGASSVGEQIEGGGAEGDDV